MPTMGYRYRTPLCILFTPQIIATACYVLAQRVVDGPHSPSLDARISSPAPSASLPTPPSHKPSSPDASRYAIEHFNFNEAERSCVSGGCLYIHIPTMADLRPPLEALSILLEFYAAQDIDGTAPHLGQIAAVRFIIVIP
jgi:cyclin K